MSNQLIGNTAKWLDIIQTVHESEFQPQTSRCSTFYIMCNSNYTTYIGHHVNKAIRHALAVFVVYAFVLWIEPMAIVLFTFLRYFFFSQLNKNNNIATIQLGHFKFLWDTGLPVCVQRQWIQIFWSKKNLLVSSKSDYVDHLFRKKRILLLNREDCKMLSTKVLTWFLNLCYIVMEITRNTLSQELNFLISSIWYNSCANVAIF